MDYTTYSEITEDLRQQIVDRLSIRARTFPQAVRRAGRLLPAQARAAAAELIAVEARLANPKLAARTDPTSIHASVEAVHGALARHKPGMRAARRRSLLAAEIGFRALVVIAAGLVYLQWQGPT
jgi:ribosome-associated translation inhibitor RaiA